MGSSCQSVWSRAQIRSSDLSVDETGHRGLYRSQQWSELFHGVLSIPVPVVPTPAAAATTSAADAAGRLDDGVDHRVVVGQTGERDLVGARREGDPASEERVEEGGVHGLVGRPGVGVVAGQVVAEVQADEPRERRGAGDEPGAVEGGLEALGQRGGPVAEELVGAVVEQVERGEAGGGRERVPRQGAGLVHGPERREVVHDLGPPTEGAHVEAAADDLAEAGEVGPDAEPALRAASAHPEAGDHLVEDQERTDAVALGPEPGEEPVGRRRRGPCWRRPVRR